MFIVRAAKAACYRAYLRQQPPPGELRSWNSACTPEGL